MQAGDKKHFQIVNRLKISLRKDTEISLLQNVILSLFEFVYV